MLDQFQQFAIDNDLFAPEDRILLAVSGGIDSVVMAHLFQLIGQSFGIAHCHFGLRAQAADLDQELVHSIAQKYAVDFHTIRWETEAIAAQQKKSIQLCARELRYDWLEQIRQQGSYQWIATAHHLNDSLETFLYNFAKGCGLRGLQGIPTKNDRIIRPLSFASRTDIAAFGQQEQLVFREDASNAKDQYARNRIRHHIVPVLKTINPALEATVAENLQRLNDSQALYDYAVRQLTLDCWYQEGKNTIIDLNAIIDKPAPTSLLYELLSPFGFNNTQVRQLLADVEKTGRQFHSSSHQLYLNRGQLIIRPLSDPAAISSIAISKTQSPQFLPDGAYLQLQYHSSLPTSFPPTPHEVYLDADRLQFPLQLKRWQKGDRFQPIGMEGKSQRLQDFFTNNKLSPLQKENCWILWSGNEICWIVGYRIDERFKIHAKSKACWKMIFSPPDPTA